VDWFVDDPVQPRSFAWMVRRCCGPVGMRTSVARYQGTQDPAEGEHRRYHDPQEGFDHSPSHYRPRPSKYQDCEDETSWQHPNGYEITPNRVSPWVFRILV
jgi:hypothetical protein